MAETLVIRADASVAMGTGHIMRCLALAQAWQDAGGDVLFAFAEITPALEARVRAEQMRAVRLDCSAGSVEDASKVAALAHTENARWVVTDGYHFNPEYQRSLKSAGLKLLCVDDTGDAAHSYADFLVNQNPHANESLYGKREPYTRLLLGTRFALLRREFARWRERKREVSARGRKILVTFGGSDPDNVTLRVIQTLSLLQTGVEVVVVVGGTNPHLASLQGAIVHLNGSRLLKDVSNMPELLEWADVAVAGAGSTCWEMCLLGLPAILIDLAPNQTPVARELNKRKAAIHFGSKDSVVPERLAACLQSLLASGELRTVMSKRAQELIDGHGAQRIVAAMHGDELRLSDVEDKDCKLLWEWANDPLARSVSFSTEPIAWEQHVKWFRSQLENPDSLLYLALDAQDVPVGLVRFQIEGARAMVSINLANQFRGKGYGKIILTMGCTKLFETTAAVMADAYVKPDNQTSLKLFTSVGFKSIGTETVRGQQAVHLVLEKK